MSGLSCSSMNVARCSAESASEIRSSCRPVRCDMSGKVWTLEGDGGRSGGKCNGRAVGWWNSIKEHFGEGCWELAVGLMDYQGAQGRARRKARRTRGH